MRVVGRLEQLEHLMQAFIAALSSVRSACMNLSALQHKPSCLDAGVLGRSACGIVLVHRSSAGNSSPRPNLQEHIIRSPNPNHCQATNLFGHNAEMMSTVSAKSGEDATAWWGSVPRSMVTLLQVNTTRVWGQGKVNVECYGYGYSYGYSYSYYCCCSKAYCQGYGYGHGYGYTYGCGYGYR